MTVLLIDNRDSFSAILHHYLWELTGEKPLFFRNDALTREDLERLDFDAAVLSPGPGHPANTADFGVCLDLLQLYPQLPVLGVCLGHQGLAHFAGATVAPWPEARHGRPSRIRHDGEGLFRGLPPEFSAIRYHSLVVDPASLPRNVRVTARSVEDDQIMGLAFTDRPWFGVQFHPEAIDTEHGKRLLANFLDLADPGRNPPAPAPEKPAAPLRAGDDIPFRELAWRDPEAAFARFLRGANPAFWLDGSHAQADSGWPSTVMGRAESVFTVGGLEEFRRWAGEDPEVSRRAPWPGYRGGPVGYFTYELYSETLGMEIPARAGVNPLGEWMRPEGYLVFDHAAGKAYAAWEGNDPPLWLNEVLAGWDEPWPPVPANAVLPPFARWTPSLPREAYLDRVNSLQESIRRGDTYEACLTHTFSARAGEPDPLAVFRRLRARNPSPYAAYLAFPDVRLLSASPELFLELSGGALRSRPIKGTRARGKNAGQDAAIRAELADNPKDRAENRMIVDLTRHDFSRVCALGSVEVTSFLRVEEHPAVFQMVSEVRGRLAPGKSPLDALKAVFPGGSMTGAPKERTVRLLAEAEAGPRGAYSGALGYFTQGRAFCLSMIIRTLENRGDDWRMGCGGAVLIDSDPEAEWREAVLKARSVIDAASS